MCPSAAGFHTNQALTTLSLKAGDSKFISEIIAPRIGVDKMSDVFYNIDPTREELRDQLAAKAEGGVAEIVDFEHTTDTFVVTEDALKSFISKAARSNVDHALRPEINRTKKLSKLIMLRKEIKIAAALSTAVTQTAAADEFWSLKISDPIADIDAGQIVIVNARQEIPTHLFLPWEVFRALRNHPTIIERVKAGGTMGNAAVVNEQSLAQVFDIANVVVSRAFKNTAAKRATASISNVWGDVVYLAIVDPDPNLESDTLALTFGWAGLEGSDKGRRVREWHDDERDGDFVEVSDYYVQKPVVPTAGYKITGTLS